MQSDEKQKVILQLLSIVRGLLGSTVDNFTLVWSDGDSVKLQAIVDDNNNQPPDVQSAKLLYTMNRATTLISESLLKRNLSHESSIDNPIGTKNSGCDTGALENPG